MSSEMSKTDIKSPSVSSALKIYIAGPDVFSPDAVSLGRLMCDTIRNKGFVPLYPLDNEIDAHQTQNLSEQIFDGNIKMIQDCDIVLANLNPFRGSEPDSGTSWEVGYAFALGKKVIGYIDDTRPMIDKVHDTRGWRVEDLGLPLNLMLCHGAFKIVQGDFQSALEQIQTP